jgi:hypothetical protein
MFKSRLRFLIFAVGAAVGVLVLSGLVGSTLAAAAPAGGCTSGSAQVDLPPRTAGSASGDADGPVNQQPMSTIMVTTATHHRLAFTGASISEPILLAMASMSLGALLIVAVRRNRKVPRGSNLGMIGVTLLGLGMFRGERPVFMDTNCLPPVSLPESPLIILIPVAGVMALAADLIVNPQ